MSKSVATPTQRRKREPAPSWHELVQPGPKGDPKKKMARAERVRHGKVIAQEGDGLNRAHRRAAHGRGWNPGRLVLHRTRLSPVDGGPRPDVLRRRAERALRLLGRAA